MEESTFEISEIKALLNSLLMMGNDEYRFSSETEDYNATFSIFRFGEFQNKTLKITLSRATTRKLLMDPVLLPGFNDSGAHLTNMAFYDCDLRALKLGKEGGDKDVSYMVRRLTRDVSEIFGIKSGTLDAGARVDTTIIDPDALETYDGEANVERIYREEFEHEQLVNRSDNVVAATIIGGKIAWNNNSFATGLNSESYGQVLTAGEPLPLAAE